MSELNSEQVKANLLENAKQSIQLGVEDYTLAKDDHKRNISAVRNIFAGLLLLYKYKLLLESPQGKPYFYISRPKSYIDMYKDSFGLETPKITVDTHGIKKVFEHLNIEINSNSFDGINKLRNNIEHFYNVDDVDILNLTEKSFELIDDFYEDNLLCYQQESLREFLGDDTYRVFLNNREIYQKVLKQCQSSFADIDFPSTYLKTKFLQEMSCPYCNSNLIKYKSGDYPDLRLSCMSCAMGDNLDKEEVLGLTHHSIKDGGDFREECPECGEYTIFIDNICLECGFEKNPNIDYEREEYLQYLRDKDD